MSKVDNIRKSGRKKRGEISKDDINPYIDFSTQELIEMLESHDPKNRTIAATILGNKKDKDAVESICNALKREKALYSRIAMSEALGKIGEPAVVPVANLLGQIGNNQEKTLPGKYFNKKSYPLVRDMAARTLIKIGNPATIYIIQVLDKNPDIFIKQQAIDALGGIAAKTGDYRGLKVIIEYFDIYAYDPKNNDRLTIWKLIRCLSAFKDSPEAAKRLLHVLNYFLDPPLIWEAARSLGQIGVIYPEITESLVKLEENENEDIKKAAKIALIALDHNYNKDNQKL